MLTKCKFLQICSAVVSVINALIIVTHLPHSCLLQKLRKLNAIQNTNLYGLILSKPWPHNITTVKTRTITSWNVLFNSNLCISLIC